MHVHYLEANEISAEHAVENFVSSYEQMMVSQIAGIQITTQELTRQTPEDLTARERCVYKESNDGLGKELSNQLRYEQQMIIVYPDKIPRAIGFDDAFSESQISGLVCGPVFVCGGIFCRSILPEKVVKEGPESCNKLGQSIAYVVSRKLRERCSVDGNHQNGETGMGRGNARGLAKLLKHRKEARSKIRQRWS